MERHASMAGLFESILPDGQTGNVFPLMRRNTFFAFLPAAIHGQKSKELV